MTQTATGAAGTSIAAAYTVPSPGEPLNSTANKSTVTAIASDLATISTGNVTLAGIKTFSSAPDLDAGCTVAQSQAITAEGTGCTLAGDWNTPSGATLTCSSGASWVVASGGLLSVPSGATVTCAAGSTASLLGRVVPRSARVAVADGDKALGVTTGTGVDYAGKRFTMATTPASARTITIKHTGAVPVEGETIECIAPALIGAPGALFLFKREDATLIASWVVSAATGTFPYFTEFEFVSGVWRLGASSGSAWDGSGDYGVIPGTGA